MNTNNRHKIFLGLMVLFLVMLACGPTPTSTPKEQSNPPSGAALPTKDSSSPIGEVEPTLESNQPTDTGTLTSTMISKLAHATVRIWGVKNVGDQVKPIYHGSGTIISPDGLILTNCHVADPMAMGFPKDLKPDALVIDLISSEDVPPVSTYLAKVVTEDPTLDLATIQIVANLDGSKVNQASLNLPSVPLGDSDLIRLGDPLYVFGYPGIGGNTITFASGTVSGFDRQDPMGDKAWIKTSTMIAGGNSGGLTANSKGQIIGIPSQVGTGSAKQVTDCRPIQDTNGDGVINDKDSCVPTGGFINDIRPINWALPLIKASQSGQAYTSPYGSPVAENPNPDPNPGPSSTTGQFTLIGWAEETDQNGCPVNPTSDFPTATKSISAIFSFSGMTDGDNFEWHWFLNGKDVSTRSEQWQAGTQGDCFMFSLSNGSDVLPDGDYALELLGGPNLAKIAQAQTSIGKSGPVSSTDGVILTGKITDANTSRGIADIFFAVLKPGFDPDAWTQDPQDNQVFSYTQTDQNGNYQISEPLQRGQKYGIIVGNNNIGYPSTTGTLTIKADDPDTIVLSLKLSK